MTRVSDFKQVVRMNACLAPVFGTHTNLMEVLVVVALTVLANTREPAKAKVATSPTPKPKRNLTMISFPEAGARLPALNVPQGLAWLERKRQGK